MVTPVTLNLPVVNGDSLKQTDGHDVIPVKRRKFKPDYDITEKDIAKFQKYLFGYWQKAKEIDPDNDILFKPMAIGRKGRTLVSFHHYPKQDFLV
jgi:hypothetical protein